MGSAVNNLVSKITNRSNRRTLGLLAGPIASAVGEVKGNRALRVTFSAHHSGGSSGCTIVCGGLKALEVQQVGGTLRWGIPGVRHGRVVSECVWQLL